jgi:hypothetical protein
MPWPLGEHVDEKALLPEKYTDTTLRVVANRTLYRVQPVYKHEVEGEMSDEGTKEKVIGVWRQPWGTDGQSLAAAPEEYDRLEYSFEGEKLQDLSSEYVTEIVEDAFSSSRDIEYTE